MLNHTHPNYNNEGKSFDVCIQFCNAYSLIQVMMIKERQMHHYAGSNVRLILFFCGEKQKKQQQSASYFTNYRVPLQLCQ